MLVNISFNLQKEGPSPLFFRSMLLFKFYVFPFDWVDALQCVGDREFAREACFYCNTIVLVSTGTPCAL